LLRLYNTRTRRTEPFVPLGETVRIYVCGLTPSAEAHLGHARSFMFFDVLRRWLVHAGYRVEYVQNVTDIDDRSIAEAAATGTPWYDIVEGFHQSFKRSMARLHVLEPDHEPRATRYVPEIVAMIAALIEHGNAYAGEDGVYFAVRSFPRYGALSGRSVDELLVGARIAPGEDKRDPLDFALWKIAKPGEPSWPSPWGDGRPGWHIECSAMSHALLGEPFDIHGGGFDLIFPHHENEIAQTESLVPPPMANVWVHGGLLQFDGKKMSKSLGNFEPLGTLLDRHDPQAVRILFLQTGYRKPMNFTEASIDGATKGLRRLQAAYDLLRTVPAAAHAAVSPIASAAGSPISNDATPPIANGTVTNNRGADPNADARAASYRARFAAAMDEDLNTAGAVSVLFDVAGAAAMLATTADASSVAAFLHEAMTLLGIGPSERGGAAVAATGAAAAAGNGTLAAHVYSDASLARLRAAATEHFGAEVSPEALDGDALVARFLAARAAAKAAKDFALADALRASLAAAGVTVRDAKEGATWTVAI